MSRSDDDTRDNDDDRRDRSERRDNNTSPAEKVKKQLSEGNLTSLLIKNLSNEISIDKLREKCSTFGEVKDVYIPIDHYTRRPKSFAFVEFETADGAHAALEGMNDQEYLGKVLEVLIAKTGRKSRDEMKSQSRSNNFSRDRGGYDRDRRGYDRDRGNDRDRGGYDRDRGSYDRRDDRTRSRDYEPERRRSRSRDDRGPRSNDRRDDRTRSRDYEPERRRSRSRDRGSYDRRDDRTRSRDYEPERRRSRSRDKGYDRR